MLIPDERSGRRGQSMPLLVGLLESSQIQRGVDGSLLLSTNGEHDDGPEIDLEELMAKQTRGGGMLDSIANMANSILGAGVSSHGIFCICTSDLDFQE